MRTDVSFVRTVTVVFVRTIYLFVRTTYVFVRTIYVFVRTVKLNRAHHLLVRAHDLLVRGHGHVDRAHGYVNRGNDLKFFFAHVPNGLPYIYAIFICEITSDKFSILNNLKFDYLTIGNM